MEGKRGNYIALAVTLSALGALLLCSQAALESARAGLALCAQMIVPSLLPFFILSSLLQQLGLPGILGRWLSPVTQKLFGIGAAAGRDGRISARRGCRGPAAAQRRAHARAGRARARILQQLRPGVSRRRGRRGRVSQRGLRAAALRRARAVRRDRRHALRPAQRRLSAGGSVADRGRVALAGAAGGRAQRRARGADGQRLCGHVQRHDGGARRLRPAAGAGGHERCAAGAGAALCPRAVHGRARAWHRHRRDAGPDANAGEPRPRRLSHRLGRHIRPLPDGGGHRRDRHQKRSGACCTERSPRCVCGFWQIFFELTRRQTRTRCRRRRTPRCTRSGAAFSSA